ncbi:MAG: nucleotide exchange factor GrpE [Terriglobia bacterium]
MDNEKDSIVPSQEEANEKSGNGSEAEKSAGGSVAPSEQASDLSEAYEKLKAERDALYDRLLRKQAELENFRKRTQREREEFLQHATADLIRALLPTLDGFERALAHRNAGVPREYSEGMELIYRELLEVLNRAGLAPIETVGKMFDPHIHQAVETVVSPKHRDQEIVEEFQRGYRLKQRLLRPAIVKVAVAAENATAATPAESPGEPTGSE